MKKTTFRKWHRRLGVSSVVFLILITLTGVLINHAGQLGLDKRNVTLSSLLDFYGIHRVDNIRIFALQPQPLSIIGNQLWWGEQLLLDNPSRLLSATYAEDYIVAIDSQQLFLFDLKGQLLEKQNALSGLPSPVTTLGYSKTNGIVLRSGDNNWFQSDSQFTEWFASNADDIHPITALAQEQQGALVEKLQGLSRSQHLSWERVLLDLHSGRLLGQWAVWFWDFIAFVILLLSISGIWLWYAKQFDRRKK